MGKYFNLLVRYSEESYESFVKSDYGRFVLEMRDIYISNQAMLEESKKLKLHPNR